MHKPFTDSLTGGLTLPEAVHRHEEEGQLQKDLDGDDRLEPARGAGHEEVAELGGVPLDGARVCACACVELVDSEGIAIVYMYVCGCVLTYREQLLQRRRVGVGEGALLVALRRVLLDGVYKNWMGRLANLPKESGRTCASIRIVMGMCVAK